MVMVNPNDACGPVQRPPQFPLNQTAGIGNQWIALVKRDHCDFDVKVWHAQLAGYVAVIVHNVNHSNKLLPMGGSTSSLFFIDLALFFYLC